MITNNVICCHAIYIKNRTKDSIEYVSLFEHADIYYFQFSLNILLYHNINHGVLKQGQHDTFLQLNVCSGFSVIFGTRNSNTIASRNICHLHIL